jgi:coproporphyrinogen III oxidase-like Fe-S oxidoreductase
MLVESLIAKIARRENARYLQFLPSDSITVPRRTGDVPALVYVHVPFCEQLCPYCSFNRVVLQEPLARAYFRALRKEILMYRELGYDFQALYVGGGTPTVLIDELAETVNLIRTTFGVKEISVETNPNHLTPTNLEVLEGCGVNRLSVGVQSFDDGVLKATERFHKYGSGEEIGARLRETQGRFHTLNIDMMFNFPMQTMHILEADLATLIRLGVDQVTYYPLMVSSSTREVMARTLGSVDYRREQAFYEKITGMLMPRYQPSTAWCFSRHESLIDEYVVNYEEYAGLGSGSIGYLGGTAYANTFDIPQYIRQAEAGVLPLMAKRRFSIKERLRYDFLMKLFGLSLDLGALRKKTGVNPYQYLWSEILFFTMAGGLRRDGQTLSLTRRGQYFWVIMMREFFIAVNNFRDYCRAKTS